LRERNWLNTMVDLPMRTFAEVDGDTFYYAIALRAPTTTGDAPIHSPWARTQISRPFEASRQ